MHRSPRPRRTSPLVAVAAAVVLAGCGGGSSASESSSEVPDDLGPPTSDPTVAVVDNEFEPEEIVVTPGTSVRWDFEGDAAHDVTSDGFASEVQRDGSFEHTFDAPGTYPYRCTLHGGMRGTVYVNGGA